MANFAANPTSLTASGGLGLALGRCNERNELCVLLDARPLRAAGHGALYEWDSDR